MIDDGSLDTSSCICDYYANIGGGKFTVIHQENAGQSVARNRGLNIARGEYIAFLDSDDIWCSDTTLEDILGVLKNYPNADFVQFPAMTFSDIHRMNVMRMYESDMAIKGHTEIFKSFEEGMISPTVWDKLFRRSASFETLRFEEGVYYEDERYLLDFLPHLQEFVVTNKGSYGYRVRPGSTLTSNSGTDIRHLCDYFKKDFHGVLITSEYPLLRRAFVKYYLSALRHMKYVYTLSGKPLLKEYYTQMEKYAPSFAELLSYCSNDKYSRKAISSLLTATIVKWFGVSAMHRSINILK